LPQYYLCRTKREKKKDLVPEIILRDLRSRRIFSSKKKGRFREGERGELGIIPRGTGRSNMKERKNLFKLTPRKRKRFYFSEE